MPTSTSLMGHRGMFANAFHLAPLFILYGGVVSAIRFPVTTGGPGRPRPLGRGASVHFSLLMSFGGRKRSCHWVTSASVSHGDRVKKRLKPLTLPLGPRHYHESF